MAPKRRYKVLQKIDEGGMAEIFKGVAFSLEGIQKVVAIKRIRPHLAENKKFVRMFLDEARLSMYLNHANIVQVFDVGRAEGTYFIVMEYVDGTNLRRLLQLAREKGKKIPIPIAVHIIIELCKALAHAHEAEDPQGRKLNIVHRDVNPTNILISKSGEVKITDFGLAKAVSQLELTDPGVVKGKFSYLSPEACEGKEVDSRADVFGAGIVLWELLTMRRLFQGKTDLETVELIRECRVPKPSQFNPEVPPRLDEITLKALRKDRKKRYQSARELADELARFLADSNMVATAFDLAKFYEELIKDSDEEKLQERLAAVIKEEVINLSSLSQMPGHDNFLEKTEELDLSEFQSRPSPFEDVWHEIEKAKSGSASDTSPQTPRVHDSSKEVRVKTVGRVYDVKVKKGFQFTPKTLIALAAVILGLAIVSTIFLLIFLD